MTQAHTPGPWRLGPKHASTTARTINAIGKGIGVFTPFGGHGTRQLDEDEANARLIAVAPDGLALAYAVAAYFADTDAPLGKMAREFIDNATAATPRSSIAASPR